MATITFFTPTNGRLFLSTLLFGFNISLAIAAGGGPALLEKTGKVNPKAELEKPAYQIKTVVIDAGHGGKDPGCLGSFTKEKNIVLSVAQKLADLFEANYPHIKVVMTRETDVFVELFERAAIANRANADLFISIHCNFMPGSSATYGTETYVMGLHTANFNLEVAKRENAAILLEDNYQKNYDYDPNSPEGHIMLSMFQNAHLKQSLQFAELVESTLRFQAGRRSRGVKQAGFIVLKASTMPSILAEIGFLSNPAEEQFLSTSQGQDQIAQGLLGAFTKYKNVVEDPNYSHDDPMQPVVMEETPKEKPSELANRYTPVYTAPAVQSSKETPAPTRANEPAKTLPNKPAENKLAEPKPVLANNYGPVPGRSPSPTTASQTNASQKPAASPPTANTAANTYTFFVQLSASPHSPEAEAAKWRNYGYPIQVIREDNLYKARTNAYSNYLQADAVRRAFRDWGVNDAFIVVYDASGKRVALQDAKKALGIP
jgi:N-acetylmuramoyl-L-alanine amidase